VFICGEFLPGLSGLGRYSTNKSFPGTTEERLAPGNPTPGPSPNEKRIWRGENRVRGGGLVGQDIQPERSITCGDRYPCGRQVSLFENERRNEYSPKRRRGRRAAEIRIVKVLVIKRPGASKKGQAAQP